MTIMMMMMMMITMPVPLPRPDMPRCHDPFVRPPQETTTPLLSRGGPKCPSVGYRWWRTFTCYFLGSCAAGLCTKFLLLWYSLQTHFQAASILVNFSSGWTSTAIAQLDDFLLILRWMGKHQACLHSKLVPTTPPNLFHLAVLTWLPKTTSQEKPIVPPRVFVRSSPPPIFLVPALLPLQKTFFS